MPNDQKLTPKQEVALLALLSHDALDAAHEAVGVSKATLWRWLQLPEFQERYRGARRQLVETAIGQLQGNCIVAARVLREVAEDQKSPASARVAAARTIIEQSISAIELMDLQERIERLEGLMPEREKRKGRRWG